MAKPIDSDELKSGGVSADRLRSIVDRIERLTRQIQNAPRDAIYICPTSAARTYTKHLAADLERSDLRIETPDFFDRQGWRGLRRSVVVDHATWEFLTGWQIASCIEMQHYLSAVGFGA